MDDQSTNTIQPSSEPATTVKQPEQPVARPKGSVLRDVLFAVLILVLMVASGYGAYLWQHKKLTTANAEIATLNGTIKTLNTKLSAANAASQQAKATTDSSATKPAATQNDLSLTVDASQYVNPAGTVTASGTWFGVDATITNPTSSTISLVTKNFELKDAQNNKYPEYGFSGATTLPAGWVMLQDQTLSPGDTVKGVILFQLPNNSVKSFTLINGTNTYPVSAN